MVGFNQQHGFLSKPAAPQGGAGFERYAAGAKHYGAGRSAPNVGATPNKTGYGIRDAQAENRKDALLRRAAGGNF